MNYENRNSSFSIKKQLFASKYRKLELVVEIVVFLGKLLLKEIKSRIMIEHLVNKKYHADKKGVIKFT